MQPSSDQYPDRDAGSAAPDAAPSAEQADRELARAASSQRSGMLPELIHFLGENKKWWLLPIIIVILLFGLLIILSGTAIAPFIYPLF